MQFIGKNLKILEKFRTTKEQKSCSVLPKRLIRLIPVYKLSIRHDNDTVVRSKPKTTQTISFIITVDYWWHENTFILHLIPKHLSLFHFLKVFLLKMIKSRSIQRTQTPPRLWYLTLTCDIDLILRPKKFLSLDFAFCIVPWNQVWCSMVRYDHLFTFCLWPSSLSMSLSLCNSCCCVFVPSIKFVGYVQ